MADKVADMFADIVVKDFYWVGPPPCWAQVPELFLQECPSSFVAVAKFFLQLSLVGSYSQQSSILGREGGIEQVLDFTWCVKDYIIHL